MPKELDMQKPDTQDEISIFHINIQSIQNKVDLLSLYLDKHSFNFVCISEHWCKLNILNCLKIHNYVLISSFCRVDHIHGGVCIFARTDMVCKAVDVNEFCKEVDAEFCAVEVPKSKLLILTVYRSCLGNAEVFLNSFDEVLDMLLVRYSNIVVLGDFNVDFKSKSNILSEFTSLINSYGIYVTILNFTRVYKNSKSCVDNILTNLSENEYSSGVVEPCLSDHYAQYIVLKFETDRSENITNTVRHITSCGIDKIKKELNNLSWDHFFQSDDADFLSEFLVSICQILVLKYLPLKPVRTNQPPVRWFNNTLRRMREELSVVKLLGDSTGDAGYGELFKQMKKKYKQKVTLTKKEAYSNFLSNSSNISKDSWKIINYERNKTRTYSSNKNISADNFNDFFISIVSKIVNGFNINIHMQEALLSSIPMSVSSFALLPVTDTEVWNAIHSLKRSNSHDVYELSSNILKELSVYLVAPLTHLFNCCIAQGTFPDCLKVVRVVPLFKKGDPESLGNYRPISLVPLLGKVFEIILKNCLVQYYERNNFLNSAQFGFRKDRSTVQAVCRVVGDIIEGLEIGAHVGLTLCDLSRAFDCVSHDLLLQKMFRYGIRGQAWNLFSSFLIGRKQLVVSNGQQSELKTVETGIPQGSVLGPLLFITYINDLFEFLSPDLCVCFADDTTLISKNRDINTLEDIMCNVRNRATDWFTQNYLQLNDHKTQELLISTTHEHTNGSSVNLLGICLDDRLSWDAHILKLKVKLSSSVYVIRHLRNTLAFNALISIYYSLFHSHISYGVQLWGNAPGAQKIFKLQKKVVRLMGNLGYREHCRPHFVRMQILTLPCMHVYQQLMDVHKNINHLSFNSDYHSYSTRSANLIRPKKLRLEKSINNSLNIHLYNKLPNSAKRLPLMKFKKEIKGFLIANAFYSVPECASALSGWSFQ